ncbi:hypothetical protein D3C71_1657720 [compost metagenome]
MFQLRLPLAACFGRPVERADTPKVDKTRQQNCYEYGSVDEARPAAFADGDGPGKEEEGFDVEDHEEHRDQIEFGGEAQAGAAGGHHAGFERLVLAAPPGAAAEQTGDAEHEGDQTEDAEQEDGETPVVGKQGA